MRRYHHETPDIELEQVLVRLAPHHRAVAEIVDDEPETAHAVCHHQSHEREQPDVRGRTNDRNASAEHECVRSNRPQFLRPWRKRMTGQQRLDLAHVVALRLRLWPHMLLTSSVFFL